jgi:hypothetical protein
MFRSKAQSSGHHCKNSKNYVQCSTNEARDVGSHLTYKFCIKLHKIIGVGNTLACSYVRVVYRRLKLGYCVVHR